MNRYLAVVLFFALIIRASGAWTVISSEKDPSSSERCQHIRMNVEGTESHQKAILHLAVFDFTKATLRIVDQPSEPRTKLAEIMQTGNWLAGVNGGYFEADYSPVGLLVTNDRMIAPLRKARLLSGTLSVTSSGQVRLQRTIEFSRKAKVTEAVQSGPFLIDQARSVTGLNDSRLARRTFVAIGKSNQVALGQCSEVSLAQLSQILIAAGGSGLLKFERVLNLDGGSSSAFWFNRGNGNSFSIAEQKPVRDFVAVAPR